MISHIAGKLLAREIDRVEVATSSGVGYEINIPLSVFERLPDVGEPIELHTHLVVKEDGWQLFGFASVFERDVFRRILLAKGVGPGLALGMISTLTANRLVRAIRDKDIAVLVSVPRIGRKKAEQIVLDLADKMDELVGEPEESAPAARSASQGPADDAAKALVLLGYSSAESERAIRAALDSGANGESTSDLIRHALGFAGGSGRR